MKDAGRNEIATLLRDSADEIQSLWLKAVREEIAPARELDDVTILDSMPDYLAQVSHDLSQGTSDPAQWLETAREHGSQRAGLNYTLRDVASEYSILRESILFVGTGLTKSATHCLNRVTDAGSIGAVEEFFERTVLAREREARKNAETSGSHFKNLVDSSPAMIWMTDENSMCTYLSRQWYEFTGRTPEQDLGVGWLENIHPDDLQETSRVYAHAVSNKGPLRVDYRLRRKTGEYRWAIDLGYPRYNDKGEFEGYIGTVTDIHDRIAAEYELREIQRRFERSSAATDLGVWYCDLPFDELTWNKEVKNHFFLSPNDRVTIETFYERIHPDDREPTRRAISESIQKHSPYNFVYRTTKADDPEIVKYIRAIGWTDYDQNDQPRRFDGITLDVTAEIQKEHELREAKAAAEAANAAKSAFLANMSHEIRTPLGAIMGFADLARQPNASRDEVASYLRTVERNSMQVLRIIDDILDLAKVEAGRVDLETLEFSLPSFLADFASLIGFRAREIGISFKIVAETDLPDRICSDPTRIRQILNNSVGNAIKFTSKGSVTLHVCYRDEVLEFGVEDTGRGISQGQTENLFQAFVQADASTTRKFGGTGLGLVLTKRLCQLMGGDYSLVWSEINVGSRFKASIRTRSATNANMIAKDNVVFETPALNTQPVTKGRLSGIKALLVEDSPDNQTLVRIILERQGAHLDIANDGMSGLQRALAIDYDIVLMDIQMPIMDGHEAVRALRSKGYTRPVVALTAHAMKEEAERARRSGFTSFLSKPIEREALIATVGEFGRR